METLGQEWAKAPKKIQRDMLRAIFEASVVDVDARRLVCVKQWPPFVPLFGLDELTERKHGGFYVENDLPLVWWTRKKTKTGIRG